MKTMYYFGTAKTTQGFFLFEVTNGVLQIAKFNLRSLPFKIEMLPYHPLGLIQKDGTRAYYTFAGWSILAIAGSCVDKRQASTTVFFCEGEMDEQNFYGVAQSLPPIQEVLAKLDRRYSMTG